MKKLLENILKSWLKIIKDGGYCAHQIFNADETGLFWKKMPTRTYIAKSEKNASGFKAAKDLVTLLLCSNASGDRMLKPLLVNRSLKPLALKGKYLIHCPYIGWQTRRPGEMNQIETTIVTSDIISIAKEIGGEGFDDFGEHDIEELLADEALNDDDILESMVDTTKDFETVDSELEDVTPLDEKLLREGLQLSELYKELVKPSQRLITDYLVKEKKITEVPKEALPCRSDDVILSSSDESDLAPIHKRDKVIKNCFVWTIDNFSCHNEAPGDYIKSSPFSSSEKDPLKWQLNIYPNGVWQELKEFSVIYLQLESTSKNEVNTMFRCSVLNSSREEANVHETHLRFLQDTGRGWPRFIKREFLFDKANDFLPDDQLTLYCEITVIDDPVVVMSGYSDTVRFKVPEPVWSKDMNFLLESQKFADVRLNVGGYLVKAHKNILAARSQVFAAMFEHEMEEKRHNFVEIADMAHEVLWEMLRFIYTGQAPNLESLASRLLPAADRYGLERLKVLCEEALGANLSVENAADVLVLADLHSAHQLKAFCIDFISTHAIDIVETQGWKSRLLQQQPHLVAEALTALASQRVRLCCAPQYPPSKPTHPRETTVAKIWCHTRDNISRNSFKWTINNFSSHQAELGKCITSSTFSHGSDEKLKWCFQIYPHGDCDQSKDYLSLYLKLTPSSKKEANTKFKLSLLNSTGVKISTKEFSHRFFRAAIDLLHDDKLTVYCEVIVIEDCANVLGQIETMQFKVPECRWAQDMGSLLESQKFSDVVLNVGGHLVQAHKNILAARSQVFAAMFTHEMEEKKQSYVEIVGVDPEVLAEMLWYIYTGKAPNLDPVADRLLVAADRYSLERLKVLCEVSLGSNLTAEKAAEALVLADLHTADQLKTSSMSYICKNSQSIISTEGWKVLLKQPQLVAEVFTALASKEYPFICPHRKTIDDEVDDWKLCCCEFDPRYKPCM
ncbi:SPOPL [Cordylochernes scorpioides]|uniref:SPOPL n=1 Tax=Cordylochernes scorpioides TaxID=51811 RepID=A0ABY6KQL0_9ARAC|nr:SPOPL [Cordylochernes scorpioides]